MLCHHLYSSFVVECETPGTAGGESRSDTEQVDRSMGLLWMDIESVARPVATLFRVSSKFVIFFFPFWCGRVLVDSRVWFIFVFLGVGGGEMILVLLL